MANLSNINNKFLVTTGGDVGIGVTSPSSKLSISGSQAAIDITRGIAGDSKWEFSSDSTALYFSEMSTGTRAYMMTIKETTGNVGIGTTEPLSKLHVNGGNINIQNVDSSSPYTASGKLRFLGRYDRYLGGINTVNTGSSYPEYDNGLDFYVQRDTFNAAGHFAMRINHLGNVGIGTTSPNNKLDVNGDVFINSNYTANVAAQDLTIGKTTTGNHGLTIVTGPTYTGSIYFGDSGNNDAGIIRYQHGNNSMQFVTNRSEAMRITSGGNLLVGAAANSDVSNLTLGHLLEANSQTVGSGVVGTYNNSGTANCPSLVVLQRDTSTDSTNVFVRFYANVTNAGATSMGGIVGNGANNVQFAALSDIREKENIKTINGSLDKISKLNPVEFDWKKTGEHIKAGFIAQEVEEIFPEYVVENTSKEGEEERKGLTGGMTSGIVAHLVKSIQELKAEVELLKSK